MKQALFYYLNKWMPRLSFKVMAVYLFLRGRLKCVSPNLKEKVYAESYTLGEGIDNYMKQFMEKASLADENYCRSIRRDMIKCYYKYGINPNEYFLHQFNLKGKDKREEYISKRDKNIYCRLSEGQRHNPMDQLNDKGVFYNLAKDWFKRDVCVVKTEQDRQAFLAFCNRNESFIAKPTSGSWGAGCKIYHGIEEGSFNELVEARGGHILEQLILQDERMALWNPSSVNTVRICSFKKKDGSIVQVYPFFKTGRKGSVVDNAGQGGVYASVDAKTGRICTDGMDEAGNSYKAHPDSGIPFLGEQIPNWEDLIKISQLIHQSLPTYQKYVGFDFALSKDKGWVVVEGNWGDFICQQSSLRRGIRKDIMNLFKEIA